MTVRMPAARSAAMPSAAPGASGMPAIAAVMSWLLPCLRYSHMPRRAAMSSCSVRDCSQAAI
jgi:hypothetical protein